MTTKETNTGNTVLDLTNAVTVARQAEQQAEQNHAEYVKATAYAATKLDDAKAKHADAKVALGKAKLTEAIALIDKVHSEAPKGSAAAKDVECLLERIRQRHMTAALSDIIHVSPYAIGRVSSSYPNLQQVAKPGAETAAAVKAETVTSGGGHQAKPTPAEKYVPQVGDRVVCVSTFVGANINYGESYTVASVGGDYLKVEERLISHPCHTAAISRFKLIERKPASTPCAYPNCTCMGSQFCGVKA